MVRSRGSLRHLASRCGLVVLMSRMGLSVLVSVMGEAKRRKQLDPAYGKERHRTRRVASASNWKRIQQPAPEDLALVAKRDVPVRLAAGFSQALDEGIEILPSANLPRHWPYRMRCVEFYPPAMDWVRREVLNDASLSPAEHPVALANACKVLGMAAMLAEQAAWNAT